MAKHVLICGLAPEVVDYTQYPGLTEDKLRAGLKADAAKLESLGYTVEFSFVSDFVAGATHLSSALKNRRADCVLVGAGVRTAPEHLQLFEKLINAIHEHAPQAKICFNTGPTDTADAVRRWA
jgi:hypothetical protein